MEIDVNSDEFKAAVAAAVESEVAALKSKNSELITELRKARQGRTIDPAEVDQLQATIDKLNDELKTTQKAHKDALKQAETLQKQYESESGFTRSLIVENGLLAELSKAGVTNPAHQKAAAALLKSSGIEVVADGEKRIAKVGDKSLADFVKEWAAGDDGKHFITAPNNSGGGASGGGNGGGAAGKGKIDGTPEERAAYFAAKFPDLKSA